MLAFETAAFAEDWALAMAELADACTLAMLCEAAETDLEAEAEACCICC